jgi:tetratricopeptide (TPR) repeat protein
MSTVSQTRMRWFLWAVLGITGTVVAQAPNAPAGPAAGGQPPAGQPQGAAQDPAAEEPVEDPSATDDFNDLPLLETLKKPTFEELMTGPAVDWLVFAREHVLRVEPVVPRPRTVEQITEQIRKGAPRPGQTESDAAKKKRLAIRMLPVTLLEGEDREYLLDIKHIKSIVYHEDMMLEEIDNLLKAGELRKAYELLASLEERDSEWPGIAPRRDQILFVDAQVKLDRAQPEHALALVESLHAKNANYNGLSDLTGKVVQNLVAAAEGAGDFRRARFFLNRGRQLFPEHPVVTEWSEKLAQQSRELVAQAVAAEKAGDRRRACDLVEQAARVWPSLQELTTPYNRIWNRWQRLKTGVVELARPQGEPQSLLLSQADQRQQQLVTMPLFQPTVLDDRIVRFRSRFLTDWEPRDLGHSLQLRLRSWQSPTDSQPLLTAFDFSRMLADRIFPGGDQYDARLAAMIDRVEIRGPFDVQVDLAQVPLRPEVLLSIPVRTYGTTGSAESEGEAPASLGAGDNVYPFLPESSSADVRNYRRSVLQGDGLPEYQMAEVIERRFPDYELALQALLRGELTMLPRVPLWMVSDLEPRKEFFTQAYALPTTHLLLLNHRKPVLKLRSFRRALVYALDRARILEEVYLREPPGNLGRLTSAPWSTRSYATSPFVSPHQYDSSLAFSLAHTAGRELKADLPKLKLVCSSDPEQVAACRAIVAAWKRIRVETDLVVLGPGDPVPDPQGDDWDLVYRTETLAEPAFELAHLLNLSPSTSVDNYRHLAAWLRRDLLDLDRAGDWNSATQIMHRLHRQLWAEVELIPLWELDDRFVCRRNLRNMPDRPLRPYQGIDRWKLDPWYPRETTP